MAEVACLPLLACPYQRCFVVSATLGNEVKSNCRADSRLMPFVRGNVCSISMP